MKKRMIVNTLIKRVDVGRGYHVNIQFRFDYQQFIIGLDKIGKSLKIVENGRGV